MVFLRRCQNSSEVNDGVGIVPQEDGGFVYNPTGRDDYGHKTTQLSYAGMTYAGLMSLLWAGASPDEPAVDAALRWISNNYTLDQNRGLGAREGRPAGQAGLYYYYYTFAKCLAARGAPTVDTAQGARPWAEDLLDALAARQKADGSFVNADPQWWESNPMLCTAYCINAMNSAWPFLQQ